MNVVADSKSFSPPAKIETDRERTRRPYLLLAGLGLFVVAAIGAYVAVTAGEQSTDDAQVAADLVSVAAPVAGKVTKVAVKENQLVKKGDVIAQLDDADYTVRVKQAELELSIAIAQAQAADAQVRIVDASSHGGFNSALAAVSGSLARVGSAAAQVKAMRANVLRARADLRKAEIDLDRARRLQAVNTVSQAEVDNAQIAYDSANAAVAQAEATLSVAEQARSMARTSVAEARGRLNQNSPIDALLATARAQSDVAQARAKSAEAQLELARIALSHTTIVAPADGTASNLTAREGQFMAIGQPVVQLIPTTTYLVANFKETQVARMTPGQRAIIRLDAFSGRKFEGVVESMSAGTGSSFVLLPADNASGNFVKVVQRVPVRIAWQPSGDVAVRAGFSADVTVDVGR